MKLEQLVLSAALAATAVSAPAATITVFTDRPTFEALLISPTTETFADATLEPGFSFSSATTGVANGRFEDRVAPPSDTTTFNFSPGIRGMGGDWNLVGPGGNGLGLALTVTFVGGGTQSVGTQIADTYSGQFFGFISDAAFASVLSAAGTQGGFAESYHMDNLTFGSPAAAIPEPSTYALMLAGLGLVGFVANRRRKSHCTAPA